MLDSTGVAQYPWAHGETLTAAALNAAIAQSSGASTGPTAPDSPSIGTIWFNTATGGMSVWDGSDWRSIAVEPGSDVTAATVTATGSTTPRTLADRFASVAHVLDFGAVCDGVTDDTAAVNAAITWLVSVHGGVLQFPRGTCLMLGAMAIPFTIMSGTNTQPMQVPILIRGAGGGNYGWNGQSFPQQSWGTVLDMRYGGGDTFGHVAKIDTRGMGTLQIEDIALVDGGTSNFLFIQTTNTVLKINNCRFRGNLANNGQACVQDAIRLGGITSSASGALQTSDPLAGFQGYGTIISNCQFDSIRECVQFGEAANIVTVSNCTVNRNCGSAKAQGAPYYFYGISLGEHGNIISGGFVEMVNYPYAVAMIGVAINRNVVRDLGMYDEVMGSPTIGGIYFDTGATLNAVYVSYTDGPLQPTLMDGPSKLNNTLINPSGVSGINNALDVGQQTASAKIVIQGGNTNANDGAQLQIFNAAGGVGFFGNYSAVKGGAYDAHLCIQGTGTGIIMPVDNLGVHTGNLGFPTHTLDVGNGTGRSLEVLNGGNTSTTDGAAVQFAGAGTTLGGLGNYSAVGFGGAYNQIITLWGAGHGILIPSDKIGIATGAALNPVGAEVGIGDGTGQRRLLLNGGNTNSADGALVLFYNNSARIGGVGNADSYLNTTYATYNRSTILAGYDGLIFCTHDVEQSRLTGPASGPAHWLLNTTTDDGVSVLQVNGPAFATSLRTGSSAGPTWTTGTGAPASTQPVGSLYSNTTGAVGSTLYVSRGAGTWNAVAGV